MPLEYDYNRQQTADTGGDSSQPQELSEQREACVCAGHLSQRLHWAEERPDGKGAERCQLGEHRPEAGREPPRDDRLERGTDRNLQVYQLADGGVSGTQP